MFLSDLWSRLHCVRVQTRNREVAHNPVSYFRLSLNFTNLPKRGYIYNNHTRSVDEKKCWHSNNNSSLKMRLFSEFLASDGLWSGSRTLSHEKKKRMKITKIQLISCVYMKCAIWALSIPINAWDCLFSLYTNIQTHMNACSDYKNDELNGFI